MFLDDISGHPNLEETLTHLGSWGLAFLVLIMFVIVVKKLLEVLM